jgi:Arc/MetJ family transcription regulator
MRRTTLDIDEDMLTKAQEILGTKGIKDTVDGALREVLRQEAWRKLRAWVIDNDELRDPQVTAEAWPRQP